MDAPKSRKRGKGDVHYIPVPGFEPGARAFSRDLRVPPQVLPVEPGVSYTYYVRAVDGYPPSPQLATSPERTFRLSRSAAPKAMLARVRRTKRRPPLLEPEDDQPEEPLGPQADGARGRRHSRSLAGLSDGERRRRGEGGGRPPRAPGDGERPKSPYASAPGPLQPGERGAGQEKDKGKDKGKGKGKDSGAGGPESGGKSPRETASAGGGQGHQSGGKSSGRSGEKKRREKPQLPGQGGLPDAGRAPDRRRTSAGGAGGSSGSRTGSGRRSGPRRQVPDATGSGPEGGGRPDAGLADKRRRDGGIPTGAETGVGAAGPETVDKEAVDALSVRRDEFGDTLKDVRVPGRTPGLGKDAPGGGGPSTDLGRGRRRRIGPAEGRDRVAISKDDLPTPAVVRSTPVSRMYRALVDEYFRRLEELAQGR